jgi:hypothetical protein
VLELPRRIPLYDWHGEGRNRTGDTTIFRDAAVGAQNGKKPCKLRPSTMGFDYADPRGSPLFRLGLGLNGRLRSKTRLVKA